MEKAQELFVVLDNRPKALGDLLSLLAENKVKIETLGVFIDSAKFIVQNTEKVQKLLVANNYIVELRDVIRTKVRTKANELAYIMERLGHVGINISYAYGTTYPGQKDITLILDVSDVDTALSLFK